MAAVIESLWPQDIKVTVLSPYVILKSQADSLTELTQGIVIGELRSSIGIQADSIAWNLDARVPALDNARYGILIATHDKGLVYPVILQAVGVQSSTRSSSTKKTTATTAGMGMYVHGTGTTQLSKPDNVAASDDEFRDLVRRVLHSDAIKSMLQSLIAAANDARQEEEQRATTTQEIAAALNKIADDPAQD